MKAVWNNQIIAESDKTIYIEGNHYFPSDSVKRDFLEASETHSVCPWKGEANYYHVVVGGQKNEDAAWYYPTPKSSAIETVRQDFTNYIAFWRGVEVS